MRNVFANKIYQCSKKNKNIFIVVADISPAGSIEKFRKKNKNNFINVGVAEQLMTGLAAGLALKKKRVFTYTISTFSLYRPFEMIRDNICYQNLPVTIVGMGAGTIYNNLGGTHMTQEDISICRSIPNMTILSPSDPLELEACVDYCVNKTKSPVYLRIGKSGEKNFTHNAIEKWKFGKIRQIKKGSSVCIITHGIMIKKAYEINSILNKSSIYPSIYSCPTLKPFDKKRFLKIQKKYKIILIIEDHSIIGGLSEIAKSECFEMKYKGQLICKSLKDKFINDYGSNEKLWNKHGINNQDICKKIIQLKKFQKRF